MLFDTHAHLNFAAFVKDREKIIKKCLENDIWLINIGTNFFTSKKAIEIAKDYEEGVYSAIGLHPMNLRTSLIKQRIDKNELMEKEESPFETAFDYNKYKQIAKNKKVVAIGEIGLDYYWKPKTKQRLKDFKDNQEELFLEEMRLAKELDLPMIIHCRMAHEDLIKILKEQALIYDSNFKGVIHSFTGTWEQAKEYMKLGFSLGFNGIIFKLDLEEVIKKISLDKMLLETDCPYLSPPNYNQERNDPIGVKYVAKEIATIKNISLEEVADQTTQNAKGLFLKIDKRKKEE